MRMSFVWLACALAALPAWGEQLNSSFKVTYALSRGGFQLAEMTDTIRFDGHRFEIRSNGRGTGVLALIPRAQIVRSSEGELVAAGLLPARYREQRGEKERTLGADFDWQTKRLTLSDNDQHEQIDLPAGSLDRLTFPYSFAFQSRTPDHVRLAMTDGRHLSAYEFKLVGKETITTPLGNVPALRYTRLREGDDPVFDLWLGLDQHLLPLRIVFTDKDGGRFEQLVTRIEFPRS